MNRLRGKILDVQTDGYVSLVDVAVGNNTFSATLLETTATAPYLAPGREVLVLFKETEVSLARDLRGMISLRNRLQATVRQVRRGTILSEVALDCEGMRVTSVVTTRSIERLGVSEGDQLEALIKANEVTLVELQP